MQQFVLKSAATIALIGANVGVAYAQEGQPAKAESDSVAPVQAPADGHIENDASSIVVTGSLIRGLPKEYVASPVFTYGRGDIVRSGAGSVSEYMLSIPQNFTGDLSDFGTSAAQIGTTLSTATTYNQYDGFAGFALRGLASDATLTLLNGRRMASIGMVEAPTVSVIPSALIERIDIIPDGASATYGADAVAGVVNIVTRKPTEGLELNSHLSTTTQTGSKNWDASLLAGHSWGSGNAYAMAMVQHRSEFIEDPVESEGWLVRITQLPKEDIKGFYSGIRQDVGDFTMSVDGSYFRRDRDGRIEYPDYPNYNELFRSTASGGSVNGNVHWQGKGATSLDLNIDYGRNKANSKLFEGLPPYGDADTDYNLSQLAVRRRTERPNTVGPVAGRASDAGGRCTISCRDAAHGCCDLLPS